MVTLHAFFLVSVVSAIFAQSFLQATQQQSILTPSTEAIQAFSQLKETNINSPFLRFFNYSAASGGKGDNKFNRQLKQTDLNSTLQSNIQRASGSGPGKNVPDSHLEVNDLNSPILSEFAEYNLQVQKYANIYPRLYDNPLRPEDLKENFYNEAVYFALENGLYVVGSLPRQLADAFAQAFPKLTPLKYFNVISNALELSLQRGGIASEQNYQVLARLYAKYLKDAMDYLEVNNAQSALHAIVLGSGTLFRSLNLNTPEAIKFIILTLIDQLSKIA